MSVLTNDQVAALDSAFIAALGEAGVRLAGVFSLGGIVNTVGGGSGSDISLTLSQATGTALSIQPGAYMALDGTTPGTTPSHGFQYNAGSGNVNLVGANLNVSGGFGFFGSSLQASAFIEGGAGRFNQITIDGSATGLPVSMTASGGDSNIDVNITPKGTGNVNLPDGAKLVLNGPGGNIWLNHSFGQLVMSGTLNVSGTLTTGGASQNSVNLTGSPTGQPVTVNAVGGDTDIGLNLVTKGAGNTTIPNGNLAIPHLILCNTIASLNTQPILVEGQTNDGGSAVAVVLNSFSSFSTSGAKLVSIQNNTVEKRAIDKDGKDSVYAGIATAGVGVSPILQSVVFSLSASSGLTSYTAPANGVYEVGGFVNVTSYSSGSVSLNVIYTDVRGGAHTVPMAGANASGTVVNSLSGTGIIQFFNQTVTCGSGTNLQTSLSITGTASADIYVWVRQIA